MTMIVTNSRYYPNAVIALGFVTTVAIILTIIAGLPWVRNTHHK